MRKQRLVVVGAGYSGILAAVRAAKLGRGTIEVSLINDRDVFVERIRLHEHAVRGRNIYWPITDMVRGSGVQFKRAMVTDIDLSKREVRLDDGSLPYDKLILAIGSTSDLAKQPPGARENAHTLDPGTSEALGRRLHALSTSGGRVTVCGGGLVGVELSSEIAEQLPRLQVTLLTSGEVAPLLQPRARIALRRMLAASNVRLHEHTTVRAVEKDRVIADESVAHDLCIATAGMRSPPLLAHSGLATNAQGQAVVDTFLRAFGEADVYVAGDAGAPLIDPGSPIAMGCKYGMPMAAQAASNAVAEASTGDAKAFDFDDTHFLISIGRRNGLVQLTHQEIVLTGWVAAKAKEIVSRSTVWALRWERHRWFNYPYLRTGKAPETLPATFVVPSAAKELA